MNGLRMVVGCMSGTSMDGIDAALVAIQGEGLRMTARFISKAVVPLPNDDTLRAFAAGAPMSARDIRSLALDLGEAHHSLVAQLMQGDTPDLIVMHGQTVLHEPPLSWQLMDPWPVATAFRCRVVTDLRSRSIAAGGQGAPLTPLADWVLFRDADAARTIVNLGGFANFTTLPAEGKSQAADVEGIGGGDICPCNLVLDRLARDQLGVPFDTDGAAALAGTPDSALSQLLASRLTAPSSRSLGSGDEARWLDEAAAALAPGDALATVCDAIGLAISHRLPSSEVVLAGGGARNRAIVSAIERHHGRRPRTSDELGVPIESREATCFAVLGALAADGVPASLPRITGSATTGRDGQWILP